MYICRLQRDKYIKGEGEIERESGQVCVGSLLFVLHPVSAVHLDLCTRIQEIQLQIQEIVGLDLGYCNVNNLLVVNNLQGLGSYLGPGSGSGPGISMRIRIWIRPFNLLHQEMIHLFDINIMQLVVFVKNLFISFSFLNENFSKYC